MRLGILGYGHLGKALAEGLVSAGVVRAEELQICAKSEKSRLDAQKKGYGVTPEPGRIWDGCDVLFAAIPGPAFETVAPFLSVAPEGKTLVSLMAGVPAARLRALLGEGIRVVRAMPSLAVARGCGITGLTSGAPGEVRDLLTRLGPVIDIEEPELEKVTAFAACGLGFAAYLLDAYKNAGAALGLTGRESLAVTVNTFQNALEMGDFADTAKQVATKGGATRAGLDVLERADIGRILEAAVLAAYERAEATASEGGGPLCE